MAKQARLIWIKHEWTPEIYKIKLYCIVIILYRMHTKNPQKTYPSQSSCNPLDAIIVSHVHKTTRGQTNATECDSRADRTALISKRFLLRNITCISIIHSGPVARTVPIKNHGQDSSTSRLESIRFKYLRLK